MDAYEIAKRIIGEERLEQQRLGQLCTTSCTITVEAPPAEVKNCKIKCKKATLSEVQVHYSFSMKKGTKVKAIVEVYKGGTKVGSGEWTHETPTWCWGYVWTDWCDISEDRTINLSGSVRPGDSLSVKFRVESA